MKASDFNPADQVVLMGQNSRAPVENLSGSGDVKVVRYEPERIELQVKAEVDGWLVVSDAFYPGWEARIDGELSPVERADLLFRAVRIGEGSHDVILSYRPDEVKFGLIVSGIAVTLCLLALSLSRRKSRASL
jgi:uncharacterized membrane protein YfhO